MRATFLYCLLSFLLVAQGSTAQETNATSDTTPYRKNIIRYNLSGALIFGADQYVVLGYERLLSHRQSISVNVGRISLPKLVSISTDSFHVEKDGKRSGVNLSIDYRFYLASENKHHAPHGLYIGPYYSFNQFKNELEWQRKNSTATNSVTSNSKFSIHTIGFELGYQFIFWKRVALDLVLAGPGLGIYNYKATFDSNIDPATKAQIVDGLKQALTQKFPGMNYVFSDEQIDANGVMRTSTLGYRYIIHIGFNF
ncbi:hypothetical protein [Paraflavitalea sp. CAU 1676]|uniref:hypothetical protein n=1 Tax=Paraflavitalea sp. CAU 1676 TaxID=3032598 RepID=UPI0023DBD34F|nr:hypothetical protein [Paraflavitalea sp. CAU 1676]MDF2191436.1 hypothetical protein [Paraflavitalea sp. CAU 1676]